MGTYLNPGKLSYEMAVNSEIFVDKSEMIQYLNTLVNTQQRFVSVSRPRRFGKTMAADMICAYYNRKADSRDLFMKRKLSKSDSVRVGDSDITWDGYLGYDDETSEVFIPNNEILDEFRTSTKTDEWIDTFESFRISQELLKATWNKDAERVAELVEKAHDRADNKTYNDEAALSYAIRYAYYAAQKYYTILPEIDTGKGYADLVLIPTPKYPDKPALVIELKYNKDADGAISQIKGRNYPDRLEHYIGNILLVGINYDRGIQNDNLNFKHHACVIEEA